MKSELTFLKYKQKKRCNNLLKKLHFQNGNKGGFKWFLTTLLIIIHNKIMAEKDDDFINNVGKRPSRSKTFLKPTAVPSRRKGGESTATQDQGKQKKIGRSLTSAPRSAPTSPILHFAEGEDDGFSNIFASKEPCVVAPVVQVLYSPNIDMGRKDVPTLNLDCVDQISHINELISLIKIAKDYIPFLYNYRSITKSLNSEELPEEQRLVKTSLKDKAEFERVWNTFSKIFMGTFEKLYDLKTFSDDVAKSLCRMFVSIEYEPSDVFYNYLTELFDVMFNIDHLKLIKTGFLNDLSFMKRNTNIDPEILEKLNQTNFWLPQSYSTLNEIQKTIMVYLNEKPDESKYLSFLSKYLNYCVSYSSGKYILPQEKNSIIIGIISALYIHATDNPAFVNYNIFDKIDLTQIFSIIEANPIIPLYGETSFAPGYVLASIKGCKNLDETGVASTNEKMKAKQRNCLLKYRLGEFQEKYRSLLQIVTAMGKNEMITQQNLLNLLQGVAEMTMAINKQSAFKQICLHQVDNTNGVTQYDRAVRLNYSVEDLDALVEVIGYVKTLSTAVIKAEENIVEFATKTTNNGIQQFVQNEIEQQLIRANGAKDKTSIEMVRGLRDAIGHWGNIDPNTGLATKSAKIVPHEIKESNADVTIYQLDVTRVEAQKFISPGSPMLKKISTFTPAHIRSKDLEEYKKFIKESHEWYYLLKYLDLIKQSTNLGSLWFREVFLDIDNVLQFPVRSSLPFILIEHLLTDTDTPSLHDSMLFPFEIYNDAAFTALNTFKSRYLYNEVQAEVNLCVDMIAFTFSETFYRFCREIAAQIELPSGYIGKSPVTPMRYQIIVQQNRLEILGAAVDFNQIATGKLNQKMKKELESYIEMLTDFRLAPYVAHLIRVAKTTHQVLVQNHLLMDPFDVIWQRAIQFTQPLSLQSRLSSLLIDSIDFSHQLFNCLTRRFIYEKPVNINPPTPEKWASEYVDIHQHETYYAGEEHFMALVEMLTKGEIAILIQRISINLQEEMLKMVRLYTQVASSIRKLTPPSKDDLIGYYSFNSDAYHQTAHASLGALFNSMRIIGNTIAFIWSLDNYLPSKNNNSFSSTIFNILTQFLYSMNDLFVQNNLTMDSTSYSFASIWSVLEFVMCSPNEMQLGDKFIQPHSTFGDGPILCAHIIITLCKQEKFYEFNSITSRIAQLSKSENTKTTNQKDLEKFLKYAKYVKQIKLFAHVLAGPYALTEN